MRSVSTRYSFRKGRIPYHPTRRVPALSTQESAELVLRVIAARLRESWSLDEIDWQRYCRDSAVIQVVTQRLN